MKYNYLDFLKKTIKIKGKIAGIAASQLTNNHNESSISFNILVKYFISGQFSLKPITAL